MALPTKNARKRAHDTAHGVQRPSRKSRKGNASNVAVETASGDESDPSALRGQEHDGLASTRTVGSKYSILQLRTILDHNRQDYNNYLHILSRPNPLKVDPSAEDPRPDLPQPRPVNPSIRVRAYYSIIDRFPQDLIEA